MRTLTLATAALGILLFSTTRELQADSDQEYPRGQVVQMDHCCVVHIQYSDFAAIDATLTLIERFDKARDLKITFDKHANIILTGNYEKIRQARKILEGLLGEQAK
jgi:hypothetical protein